MKLKEQELLIQRMLSASDIFARCFAIIKPEYFDQQLAPVITHILNYYEKYHNTPDVDSINVKFDKELKKEHIPLDVVSSSCDEIERFCQQSAITKAIMDSLEEVDKGEYGKLQERFSNALSVSLAKDLGVDMFVDPENYIKGLTDNTVYYPTGIRNLDAHLDGGLARQSVTLFSANSGGGKSVMLSNLACNYAVSGMHVLLISLELSEKMIFLRNAFIMSGVNSKKWKDHTGNLITSLLKKRSEGAGSLTIKRLPGGTNCNHIRAYLKQYELEFKRRPDVIILDYLDQLTPNGGSKNIGVWEQDKQKSEQFYEICHLYDAIGITASQQNRGAIEKSSPDQSVVAGGLSKVNTVDNYISLRMTPDMRLKNEMGMYFLKTRSSDGVGKVEMLRFDSHNLRITDPSKKEADIASMIKMRKKMEEEIFGIDDIKDEEHIITEEGVIIQPERPSKDSPQITEIDNFMNENLNLKKKNNFKSVKNNVSDILNDMQDGAI